MKDTLSKIMLKIQEFMMKKRVEFFLWFIISGFTYAMIGNYLIIHHLSTIYSDIFLLIFIYYASYKIILE